MDKQRSDALVFFGATGDLAYKKIFPGAAGHGAPWPAGLHRHRGGEVGMDDRSARRARSRVLSTEYGGLDPDAFAKLVAQLTYIDGDYNDPETFTRLRAELGDRTCPAHYLAIPPSLFPKVVGQLARRGLHRQRAGHRRETVRPRPGVGA